MILWLLLSCGSDSNGSEVPSKVPIIISEARAEEVKSIETTQTDVTGMNKDADCLIQYVRDMKTAQNEEPNWDQPDMGAYEMDDCKSQFVQR